MFAQISLLSLAIAGSRCLLLLNKLPKHIMTEDRDFALFSESQKSGQDSTGQLVCVPRGVAVGRRAMGAGCTSKRLVHVAGSRLGAQQGLLTKSLPGKVVVGSQTSYRQLQASRESIEPGGDTGPVSPPEYSMGESSQKTTQMQGKWIHLST